MKERRTHLEEKPPLLIPIPKHPHFTHSPDLTLDFPPEPSTALLLYFTAPSPS